MQLLHVYGLINYHTYIVEWLFCSRGGSKIRGVARTVLTGVKNKTWEVVKCISKKTILIARDESTSLEFN